MPGQTSGGVAYLNENYQNQGGVEGDEAVDTYDPRDVVLEDLPEATIEDWLLNPAAVEEWVALRTRPMKVLIRAMTEEERQDIDRSAPRKVNRQTRRPEPDQNWINMELVRRAIIRPAVGNNDLLKKGLAGDLAHIAGEIGRISGFELGDASD